MNVLEKQAWFTLAVIALALMGYGIIWMTTKSSIVAFSSFGLCGLLGCAGLIGRKEKRAGRVAIDERDAEIERKGTLVAYAVYWLLFVAILMTPFFVLGSDARITISTAALSQAVMAAFMLIMAVRSLVIVFLYKSGRHA